MGRLKIKKKESVLPFRETLAYRMMLLTGSVVTLLISLFVAISALQSRATGSLIVAGIVGAAAALGVVYNAGQMRNVKIPQQTLKRMKRR